MHDQHIVSERWGLGIICTDGGNDQTEYERRFLYNRGPRVAADESLRAGGEEAKVRLVGI